MGIMRTFSRVLAGFVLACITAGLVQVLYVSTPTDLAAVPAGELPAAAGSTFELALLAATHTAIFSAAFASIIAGISEWLSLRTMSFSLAAGMGIALLGFFVQYSSEVAGQPSILNNYALQAFLTTGFFAGLIYWMVAGRHAGERTRAMPAGAPAAEAGGDQSRRQRILVEKTPDAVKKGSLAERLADKRAAMVAAGKVTAVPVVKGKTGPAKDGAPATPEAAGEKAARPPEIKKDKPAEAPKPPAASENDPGEAGKT